MNWPDDERREIEEIVADRLEEHMGRLLPGEGVLVTGETLASEIRAGILLRGLEDGSQLSFEARLERSGRGCDEEEGRCLLLDALDCLIFEWIASGRTQRFHGGWQARFFQGHRLAVRIEKCFPELDARADALLAAAREGGSRDPVE